MSTLKYYFLPKISQIRKQGNLRFPPNSFVSGEKFFNHFRRGVTGFVGSANKPIPLTEEEVLAMGMEKHEIVVQYQVGDHVKIVDGPLASFTGVVEEIEPEKNRVSVMVSMFGRETPVDLELDQVEVLN